MPDTNPEDMTAEEHAACEPEDYATRIIARMRASMSKHTAFKEEEIAAVICAERDAEIERLKALVISLELALEETTNRLTTRLSVKDAEIERLKEELKAAMDALDEVIANEPVEILKGNLGEEQADE